jgi:hypothetical protein
MVTFDQQGQQVAGSQYNADRITIYQQATPRPVDPETLAAADYWFYVEANYAIRNSKITANDVGDAFDKHLKKNHPRRLKSNYKEWLEEGIE